MKLQTYALYDSKARCFSQPFQAANTEVALRMFASTAADSQTNIHKFPTDFSLFHIGEFDDEIGVLIPLPHTNLGPASQFQTSEA